MFPQNALPKPQSDPILAEKRRKRKNEEDCRSGHVPRVRGSRMPPLRRCAAIASPLCEVCPDRYRYQWITLGAPRDTKPWTTTILADETGLMQVRLATVQAKSQAQW
jgi:hypothetical protein